MNKWIYEGDFEVTSKMVDNGILIKEMIPDEVIGYFDCSYNKLTSLQHCPSLVGGNFYCHYNQLTSLQHCPSAVGGNFFCDNNQLTSLQYCPSTVGGNFYCNNNKLTSLEGCPSTVGGDFSCSYNKLTSLQGCPSTVGGNFDCNKNLLDLTIEQEFIESGSCSSQESFFIDLLKYMINKKIDLATITTWPDGFLSPEVISSAKGMAKFML